MKKRLALALVIALFLIVNVSAGIYFSQPEAYYNLGDVIQINVSVDPILEGFLMVDLVCEGGSINVFNGMPDEQGEVGIKFPLTFSYIKENSGDCYFFAQYFGLSQRSSRFEISQALDVELDIYDLVSKPGGEITIAGSARRLNEIGINGDVEITIPLLKLASSESEETGINETEKNEEVENCIKDCEEDCDEEIDECYSDCGDDCEQKTEEETEISSAGIFYGKVVNGSFSVSLELREDTAAGNYRIDVLAYETDELRKITSEGVAMANLKVEQVLKKAEIAMSIQNIDPGKTLNFKPMLIDQSGQPIYDEVSVIIRDKNLNRIFEKILQSEKTVEYEIPTDLSFGYYEIEVASTGISSIKKFYINEKAIALFEIKNNTLIVINVGNIPYKKDIQIELNDRSFIRKIDLGMGKRQELVLEGDGNYNIKVSDGETEIFQGGVMLTGHAVNVDAVKRGFVALNTPIVWIFFIIILGAGILFLFRNILKKKSFTYPFKEKLKAIKFRKKPKVLKAEGKAEEKPREKEGETSPLFIPTQAEPVLVLKGQKNKAVVLVLKIKNKLSKRTKQELQKMLSPVYKNKGGVYERGDNIIAVFSPLMTKSFRNEIRAAKSAELIQAGLKEYNKKFADKIEFGIGINSGEVVNKIEDKKLKFTALGNLIPGAKRIAEASDEEILLTKQAYEKGGSEIKVTKKGEVYELRRVLDAEKNKKFLDGFLKRIGAEKDKKGEAAFSLE